jgi:hypothetical protein
LFRRVSSSIANAKPRPAFRWVAVFCALTVWVLGLAAASPQLHAALHPDADHTDHTCAVTLFSHGFEDGTGSTFPVCAPALFVEYKSTVQPASPVADVLHRLPPGRGPPSC